MLFRRRMSPPPPSRPLPVRPSDPSGQRWEASKAEYRLILADWRAEADRLVQDGSWEGRQQAQRLRCQVARGETYIRNLEEYRACGWRARA
jgi:hypothetical protein